MSTSVSTPLTIGIPLDRIKQEVIFRLRWSILGSVEDIQIQTGLRQDGTEERLPFLSHPLAMEFLTDPPVKCVTISLADVREAMHSYMAPDNYQYELQTIENADGSPLTIKDFVMQLHSHFGQHKDLILFYRKTIGFNHHPPPPGAIIGPESRISYYTAGKHDLFFKRAFASTFSDPLILNIYTFLEGEIAVSAEAFWKSQRAHADRMASLRANTQGSQLLE
ncbi:hypothetical protein FB567DRAFT_516113 [Paraphoma chrysanthemicola]|uniref:Uncharacterized protein n=1 Tax=Paraphoma chrysanthemicola TaxID=798071 RepID=A0A8K0W2X7_9PLEO|nr:hypothetical protein FB567DRAFT_516113 [Paraphoma chrysanthemicola]